MDDVLKGEYSMTCVFLGDEGCNCANQECNKHWGDDRGAKVCPHCGHTEQKWWASWVENTRQWQASGHKGYFVYNASVKLGPGQRMEKQYLEDNGLEYVEVSMEQFHLIRRPDTRHSDNLGSVDSASKRQIRHTDNPMREIGPAIQHSNNPMLASPRWNERHALGTRTTFELTTGGEAETGTTGTVGFDSAMQQTLQIKKSRSQTNVLLSAESNTGLEKAHV
jgi:hypothetical protein